MIGLILEKLRRRSGPRDHWRRMNDAALQGEPERRYYGDGGTVHDSGTVDVRVVEGVVTEVWFRCTMLPFTVREGDPFAGGEQYSVMTFPSGELLPRLSGVELID